MLADGKIKITKNELDNRQLHGGLMDRGPTVMSGSSRPRRKAVGDYQAEKEPKSQQEWRLYARATVSVYAICVRTSRVDVSLEVTEVGITIREKEDR